MFNLIEFLLDPSKTEAEKLAEMSDKDFFKKYSVNIVQEKTGNTVLHIAALQNYPKITLYLINAGASVDMLNNKYQSATPLHFAIGKGYLDVVKVLVRNAFRADIVYYKDKDEYINTLIDMRVHRDEHENELYMTALHLAINTKISGEKQQANYTKITEVLLENGANAELRDGKGLTALHAALLQGKKDLVKLLIEYGADVRARTWEGWDALKLAREYCDDEIIKLINEKVKYLAITAPENSKERSDQATLNSILHIAVLQGKKDLIKLLMEHGADIRAKTWGGRDALQLAKEYGHNNEVVKFLERKLKQSSTAKTKNSKKRSNQWIVDSLRFFGDYVCSKKSKVRKMNLEKDIESAERERVNNLINGK